jgi:riboflavin kinase
MTTRPPIVGDDSGPTRPYPIYLKGKVSRGFGRGSKELGIPTGGHLLETPNVLTGRLLTRNIVCVSCLYLFRDGSAANLPEDVSNNEATVMEIGVHYGWASVGSSDTVYGMVMSYGWNPYYKNEKKTAVSWEPGRVLKKGDGAGTTFGLWIPGGAHFPQVCGRLL